MNDIKTTNNMLYFYNLAKELFSELDFSKIPTLGKLLSNTLTSSKVIIIHNKDQALTAYNDDTAKKIELSELVGALPLLFQSYSYSKIEPEDIELITNKLELAPSAYKDAACFAIDISANGSIWFVFLNTEAAFSPEQEALLSDIYLFLEDIVSFSANVSQGKTLTETLRNEQKKQSIWLESLAWLNELGNQEYSDNELNELYKSALFQLKMLVRADYAVAFSCDNDQSFKELVSHGEENLSSLIKDVLDDLSAKDGFAAQSRLLITSTGNEIISHSNIETLNLYPLFFQKKLKLVLAVSKADSKFDDHENMIATLFSEGLEHIIERMYFLSAMRNQNAVLNKEKLEQQVLISKLRDAQEQLLQNEKMASIGQLAAGVAHEINNPVGYVSSNINSLDGYVSDIYDVLDIYKELEEIIDEDNDHRKKLKKIKSEIDFDFIRDDIKELINESKEGVLRVKQIVKDLKDFSHVDEAEWQLTDLEQGIESTLNIVHNELKYKAKIYREYQDIPKIECVPPQINQIMMNLLVNAGHAIDEQGSITIKTGKVDDNYVYVDIIDTGKGIAPEHLTKIFDPFFTTKPVGQGTGLGLSLSYSIAENHGGELSVKSIVGEGTTFRLKLPIKKVDGNIKP